MTDATEKSASSTSSPPAQGAPPEAPASALAPAPAPVPVFTPEPERPFRPHGFQPRAELLAISPRVLITPNAYKKMSLYVEIASKEVGWLGTATLLPSGDILIDETYLLEQEVTSTETELSVEGQNKLVMELVSQGDAGIDQTNRLRFWGHSHVRMATGASGTDESTMVRFGRDGIPWYVRGIFNKLGRAQFTLYFYERGYRINDAPWAVYDPIEKKVILEGGRIFRRSRFWERPDESLSPVTKVPPTGIVPGVTPAPAATTDGVISGLADGATAAPVVGPVVGKPPSSSPAGSVPAEPAAGGLLSWTSNQADRERAARELAARAAVIEDEPLPAILVPSDELRASVQAEFKEKVVERSFFGGWFFGGDKDAAGTPPTVAGPDATGSDPAATANQRHRWVKDAEGKWSRIVDTSVAEIPSGVKAPGQLGYDPTSGPDDRHPHLQSKDQASHPWGEQETWFDRLLAKVSAWLSGKPKDD